MIWIKFGSWCHKAGSLFVYDRVYTNSGKPTPIVVVHFRHVGAPPLDKTSKLNNDTLGEFVCEIIEHFEDFLDVKGIKLDTSEKQEAIDDGAEPESIANIYGTDYGLLQFDIKGSLERWGLIESVR